MDIASPRIYHLDEIIWASSHMNPRAGLDHGEKMYGFMIFRGMVQYDWLGYEFFTGRGLHYNQDCSWWRPSSIGGKVTWLSTWLESLSRGYVSWATWNLCTTSNPPTRGVLLELLFLHLVSHINCCLKEPCVGLELLTDRCTSSP
jgi:hypothetical protein